MRDWLLFLLRYLLAAAAGTAAIAYAVPYLAGSLSAPKSVGANPDSPAAALRTPLSAPEPDAPRSETAPRRRSDSEAKMPTGNAPHVSRPAGALSGTETRESLLARRAEIMAQIETLAQGGGPDRSGNPHADAYEQAKLAYDRYWKKANALQAKWESAEGGDRMRYFDELRSLKGEDIRVGKAYERAKANYEAWKRQNPEPPSTAISHRALLQSELAKIDRKLDDLGAAVSSATSGARAP